MMYYHYICTDLNSICSCIGKGFFHLWSHRIFFCNFFCQMLASRFCCLHIMSCEVFSYLYGLMRCLCKIGFFSLNVWQNSAGKESGFVVFSEGVFLMNNSISFAENFYISNVIINELVGCAFQIILFHLLAVLIFDILTSF